MASIFDRDEFARYKTEWYARYKELTYRASYYDGSVYRRNADLYWTLGPRVNKEIKPMFMPLSRAVDIDAGLIGNMWTFPQDEPRVQAWELARDLLFDMSDWDINGVLFVHYGAQYGLSGLRVADRRDQNFVSVMPVPPTKYMPLYNDIYDDEPAAYLWIEQLPNDDGNGYYEYAEYITAESIRTFRDGQPYGYAGRESEYPNTIGRLPIIEVMHINDGTPYGACTYEKVIPLINEVNEMATRLSRIIALNADPQAVIIGAEPSELTRSSETMWFMPPGSDARFLTPTIDIDGVLEFIREIHNGVKEGLPELSWDDVRKNGQVAAATLEIQMQELVIKMLRIRPNYDRGLTYAMQMCGALLPELRALDDDELILDTTRPVLPQTESDKIALEMQRLELEQMQRSLTNGEGVNA